MGAGRRKLTPGTHKVSVTLRLKPDAIRQVKEMVICLILYPDNRNRRASQAAMIEEAIDSFYQANMTKKIKLKKKSGVIIDL